MCCSIDEVTMYSDWNGRNLYRQLKSTWTRRAIGLASASGILFHSFLPLGLASQIPRGIHSCCYYRIKDRKILHAAWPEYVFSSFIVRWGLHNSALVLSARWLLFFWQDGFLLSEALPVESVHKYSRSTKQCCDVIIWTVFWDLSSKFSNSLYQASMGLGKAFLIGHRITDSRLLNCW